MSRLGSHWVATLALVVCMLVWLWPIGFGGKMPVGGDVTQFFMGLMGVLSSSLRAGELPAWNDLWGYGFPGVAESQMGVYYPPHLVLYLAFSTEVAYTLGLVLHTIWGALGAFWFARRLGVSPVGSMLAGFAFSASGFFVIHIPHPWGYTTASWMPWAWGHAWLLLNCRTNRLAGPLFRLSLILVLQLLPGHFQIAFITQTGIVLMALWMLLIEPRIRRSPREAPASDLAVIPHARNAGLVAVCLAMAFPLASLQLIPTARLARLASNQRDFNYLSLCATTPLHLVNYVAPGLFHRSPLWRPLVWTPFHTSPEEQLAYVGLVPLFLAVLVMVREARNDPAVRLLALLVLASVLLSLGPFVPGFSVLIRLPGFSFFRAPARWGVATSLALALAGRQGLRWVPVLDPIRPSSGRAHDSIGSVDRLRGWWHRTGAGASSGAGHPGFGGLFQTVFQARPWADDPDFFLVQAQARKPAMDSRVPSVLERSGIARKLRDPRSFAERRHEIYLAELGETAALLAAISVLALVGTTRIGRPVLPTGLLVLSLIDLILLGRHKLTEYGPLRPLVEQSPVLARLKGFPDATRTVDGFRNLAMLAGVAPISAYRTLDFPALVPLTALAQGPLGSPQLGPSVRKAMRAAGARVRVLDPFELAMEKAFSRGKRSQTESVAIDDPALAGWLFGSTWVTEQGEWSTRFRIIEPESEPHRAWFVPLTDVARPAMLETWSGEVGPVLELFDRAQPLSLERRSSQLLEVSFEADAAGWIIVTQLADPQWQGRWIGRDGRVETLRGDPARLPARAGGRRLAAGGGSWPWPMDVAHAIRCGRYRPGADCIRGGRFGVGDRACHGGHSIKKEGCFVSGLAGVAIVGASGYAARELIGILLGHPGVKITAATSRQDEAPGWTPFIPA